MSRLIAHYKNRYSHRRSEFTLDVDLDIELAGITVIFGASGSGKTRLLRLLAGLDQADSAYLKLADTVLDDNKLHLPTHQRQIAYVFQEASVFEHLSVAQNLAFAKRYACDNDLGVDQDELLALLGIKHLLARAVADLSGGERQRVAIAQAVLRQPKLLLMDEPLAALDESRRQEILPYLERLKSFCGIPILYISHSIPEVARLADYLVVMEQGRIVSQGSLSEVMLASDLAFNQGEQRSAVLNAQFDHYDEDFQLIYLCLPHTSLGLWISKPHNHPSKPETATLDPLRLSIRASDVSVSLQASQGSSIQNILPAVIVKIEADKHPAFMSIQLDLQGHRIWSRITRRSLQRLDLQLEMPVYAQIKSAALIA